MKTEIPKQQARLAELEQQERDGLSAVEDTILELKDKMSGKDGILGNSDDKSLGSRDSKKYKDAVDAQRNVGYTDLYKQEPTAVVHGVQSEQVNSMEKLFTWLALKQSVKANTILQWRDMNY